MAASLFFTCDARALSFDERWKSMYLDSEVSGDKVSAKAEMMPRADQQRRAERPRAHRHRVGSRRGERRREWYKGGRKWHYVYSRKRARR